MVVNLFNANFYRAANPDLAAAGLTTDGQLLSHFQNNGLNEGRAFSAFVSLNVYRSSNPDVAAAFTTNGQIFQHLQNYGVSEGRRFSQFCDLNFYRGSNADLANLSNEQLFGHLQNYGINEGRRFSQLVDLNFYKSINSDLSSLSNFQALQHLELFGVAEGRRFSTFANLNVYRAANPDLAAIGFDNRFLLVHLASSGIAEGRRFSVSFDANYYRSVNSDLAQLNNNQLLNHFELYGLNEGRASSESFNVSYYLANNSDLRAAGFTNRQARQHFEVYGLREGRLAAVLPTIPSTIDPGNTLDSVLNIGVLSRKRTANNFVGSADLNDYYRFTLAETSNFSLLLKGLSSNAYVELIIDRNGNGQYESDEDLYYTSGSSSSTGSINRTLGSGTYFARVYTYNSYNTNYTLEMSATATPPTTPRDPGSTLATALNIGNISNNTYKDFVGSLDREDYYRFNLTGTSNFSLSLSSLSNSAYAEVILDINGNGEYEYDEDLYYTSGYSSSNGSINQTLGAGTYFVRIYTYDSSDTNYTLNLAATATPPTTPRDPGSTLSNALDVGNLSSISYKEFVGSVDRDDYYRFTLTATRNFSLSLSGLSNSAYVELILDSNNNEQYEYNEDLYYTSGSSSKNGSMNRTLGVGTYYVRVYTYNSSDTNYNLTLFAY
ncbi:MAG: hypothetical protein RMY29_011070 [Nostoc sp. CreGUA01]|nr:hypothetical protein [Nostoc sp. CreGUA01]